MRDLGGRRALRTGASSGLGSPPLRTPLPPAQMHLTRCVDICGHNVAFTLTRYGGLFEDGSEEAVNRLDALPAWPLARVAR